MMTTSPGMIPQGPAAHEAESAEAEGEPPSPWVDIAIEDASWSRYPELFRLIPRLVAAALAESQLSPETHSVSVALLPDAAMRNLNRLFRGKDSPTNVLSFPAAPQIARPGAASRFLGDIALGHGIVAAEAANQGKTVTHHAAHLVVHGVLHLSGFDHMRDGDAELMEAAESAVLARLGIPDPYGHDASAPRAMAAS